jgi:signal transduction histidine kinase
MLYSRLEKAESREQQSMIFSRETIIAQEHERKRIARELHDAVAQDLWRLSFQIDNEQIVEEQRAIIQRIRTICDTLIPPDFQRRGLFNALKKLMLDFQQRVDIACHVTIQEGLSLESMNNDTQLQCFRIAQECLTNIEKHAEATEVLILVRKQENDLLSIYISDNGKGFLPPDRDSCHLLLANGHFGLWGIYERASSISGTLTIESVDGEGTMITLQVPFLTGGKQ